MKHGFVKPTTRACTVLAMLAGLLAAAGCTISKNESSDSKNVSIEMPGASIHVDKGVSVAGIDLPDYPGAQAEQDAKEGRKNVEIDGPFGKLQVVKLGYITTDTPGKVKAYYREALAGYGTALECKGEDTSITIGYNSKDGRVHGGGDPVYCSNGAAHGETEITLKVGTQDNAHIVYVHPKGGGAGYTLVRVRTSDEGNEVKLPGRQPS